MKYIGPKVHIDLDHLENNYNLLSKDLQNIPIMATEYAPGGHPASYAPWIVHQATDFLRGDVAVKGGLTPCMKTAHMAEGFRMNYEVHHGGNSHNNFAVRALGGLRLKSRKNNSK